MNIEKPDYLDYLEKLAAAAGMTEINSFASLKEALKNRMAFFASMGCNVSDHALEYVMYDPASDDELEEIFLKTTERDGSDQGRGTEVQDRIYAVCRQRVSQDVTGLCSFIMDANVTTTLRCSTSLVPIPVTTASTTMLLLLRWQIS